MKKEMKTVHSVKDEGVITFLGNDALYNAGLLGLMRVLDRMPNTGRFQGKFYKQGISGNTIDVDISAFDEHFVTAYFEEMTERYQKDTVFVRFMMELNTFLENESAIDEKAMEKFLKNGTISKLSNEKGPYNADYTILKEVYHVDYDFIEQFKKIKASNSLSDQIHNLKILREWCSDSQVRQILILKGIVLTRVKLFWQNVAFLKRQNLKKDIIQTYRDKFIAEIEAYVPSKRGEAVCFQCGIPLASGASSIAWVNDTLPDIARKTSGFWNHNADLKICPFCAIVYSCLPFGFSSFASESFFVNDFRTIGTLKAANNEESMDEELKKDGFAVVMNRFKKREEKAVAKNALQNVQVIRRNWGGYKVNTLTAELLQAFSDLDDELEALLKGNPFLFHSVIEQVLENKNLYDLLLKEYREALSNKKPFKSYLMKILDIQNRMFVEKKGVRMTSEQKEKTPKERAYGAGMRMNAELKKKDANAKKSIGTSYQLINALQTDNRSLFASIIERMYISNNMSIPKIFMEMLNDETEFQIIGHAFIQGLNGYLPDMQEKTAY